MKKKIFFVLSLILCLVLGGIFSYFTFSKTEKINELPKQEKSEGLRGVYDIDKNINELTIDNYLDRSDVVYRDVRMLEDTATWENKGGERDLTGFVSLT